MIINYSDQNVIKNKKSIFLAGPTPRNENIESWRTKACKILEELNFDGVVYVPEYSNRKPKVDYVDQANWERDALINSTVVIFWIPRSLPDMQAFTTNVEFGYWLHTGKVIYGRPDYADKIRYLDWLYKEDCNKEPKNNLEDVLKEAVELADELYDGKIQIILPLKERKVLFKR